MKYILVGLLNSCDGSKFAFSDLEQSTCNRRQHVLDEFFANLCTYLIENIMLFLVFFLFQNMNAKRDFILSNTHKLLVDHIVFSARVYLCLGNYLIVDSILCQSTELFVLCNHYMSMVSMDQFSNYIGLSFHSVVLLLVVVDFHTLIHTLWYRLACI